METSNDVIFVKVEPEFYLDDDSNKAFVETRSTKNIDASQANCEQILNTESLNEADSAHHFSHIITEENDLQPKKVINNQQSFKEINRTIEVSSHLIELLETETQNNNWKLKMHKKKLGKREIENDKEKKRKEKKKNNTTSQEMAKALECCVCSKKFNTPALIKIHARHDMFHMRCLLCNIDYTDPEKLYADVKSHTKDIRFTCENCGNSYKSKGSLFNHKKKCGVDGDLFKCDMLCTICGKGFDRKILFTQHMMVHEDVRPFPCRFCAKSFRNKFKLKEHEHVHLDIKPYACDICSKSFVTTSDLKRHRAKHNIPGYKGHATHKSPHNIVRVTMHTNQESDLDCSKDTIVTSNSSSIASVKLEHPFNNQGNFKDCNKNFESASKIDLAVEIINTVDKFDSEARTTQVSLNKEEKLIVNPQSVNCASHSPVEVGNLDHTQDSHTDGFNKVYNENFKYVHTIEDDMKKIEHTDDSEQIQTEINEESKQFNQLNYLTEPTQLIATSTPRSNYEITFNSKLKNELFKKEKLDESTVSNHNRFTNTDVESHVKKEFTEIKIELEISEKETNSIDEIKNEHTATPYTERPMDEVKCCICKQMFKNARLLKKHKHDTFEMLCITCNATHTELKAFRKHLNRHAEKNIVTCNICGVSFRRKSSLICHLKECEKFNSTSLQSSKKDTQISTNEVDNIKPLEITDEVKKMIECCICQKQFKNALQLKKHRHNTFRMMCLICDLTYTDLEEIQHHINKHIKPLICNACGGSFRTRTSLINHLKKCGNVVTSYAYIHPRLRKKNTGFLCTVCGKKLGSKHSMTEHMMYHADMRPFPCNYCPKRFRNKVRLSEHENTHLGIKPYMCDICAKCFISSSDMKRHKVKHEKPGFKSHVSRNNPNKLTRCLVCDVTVYNLRKHSDEHYTKDGVHFRCNICKKNVREKTLYKHYRMHLNGCFHKCDVCEKSFNGKERMLSHRKLHEIVANTRRYKRRKMNEKTNIS